MSALLPGAALPSCRVSATWCVHRRHDHPHNQTIWTDVWGYAMETLLHELFLLSEHRTFDPKEADFFYVPHQGSCLPFPIGSWADHPWFPGPGGTMLAGTTVGWYYVPITGVR